MKKMIKITVVLMMVLIVSACGRNDGSRFKKDYESLNGVETKTSGVYYRDVNIKKNNPFVYTSLEEVNGKINSKETFIVYFGANWCPWCRSVIETFIDVCKEKNIKTVYYVDVRPNNDEAMDIRDVYAVNEAGNIYVSHSGTKAYHEFLEHADSILSPYSSHGVTLNDGTKRVGAPNFIYVLDGVPVKKVTGVSPNQSDAYGELTDEMKEDTREIFKEFLATYPS